MASRAIDEYLAVLDDAAFGAATQVTPKFISPADPAARWTGAHGGLAFFAYSTNYLIDLDNAIIVDVEASTAIRQAEVTAAKTMIERVAGAASSCSPNGWLPTPPTDRPRCSTGWCTSTGSSLIYPCSTSPSAPTAPSRAATSPMTMQADAYICPGGKDADATTGTLDAAHDRDATHHRYRASNHDCEPAR